MTSKWRQSGVKQGGRKLFLRFLYDWRPVLKTWLIKLMFNSEFPIFWAHTWVSSVVVYIPCLLQEHEFKVNYKHEPIRLHRSFCTLVWYIGCSPIVVFCQRAKVGWPIIFPARPAIMGWLTAGPLNGRSLPWVKKQHWGNGLESRLYTKARSPSNISFRFHEDHVLRYIGPVFLASSRGQVRAGANK